jgi:Cu2+-exporting ATPase
MELGTVNFISSFLCVLDVFIRAYKSIITGISICLPLSEFWGSILFSWLGCFFLFFPDEFKTHNGTVSLYFEATTVILTLVLLDNF